MLSIALIICVETFLVALVEWFRQKGCVISPHQCICGGIQSRLIEYSEKMQSFVTIFSLYVNVYKHVYKDFTKDEKEKSQYQDTFVAKQRKAMGRDLEKCCMTT